MLGSVKNGGGGGGVVGRDRIDSPATGLKHPEVPSPMYLDNDELIQQVAAKGGEEGSGKGGDGGGSTVHYDPSIQLV